MQEQLLVLVQPVITASSPHPLRRMTKQRYASNAGAIAGIGSARNNRQFPVPSSRPPSMPHNKARLFQNNPRNHRTPFRNQNIVGSTGGRRVHKLHTHALFNGQLVG